MHSAKFRLIVILIFISITYSFVSCQENAAFQCNDCWKSEDSDSAKAPYCGYSLNYYIDSIVSHAKIQADDWILKRAGDNIKEVFSLSVDTIGLLTGRPVLDLIYKIGTPEKYIIGKSILLEASRNRYHILYVYVNQMGELFPVRSRIVHVDSHDILATKSRLGGQLSTYSVAYWTWDESRIYPCMLNFNYSFKELFVLDENKEFAQSWMFRFDPDSLYSWSYVMLPGDHYRRPTGGKVWVKFGIDDCELYVVEKGYDSTDIAPH